MRSHNHLRPQAYAHRWQWLMAGSLCMHGPASILMQATASPDLLMTQLSTRPASDMEGFRIILVQTMYLGQLRRSPQLKKIVNVRDIRLPHSGAAKWLADVDNICLFALRTVRRMMLLICSISQIDCACTRQYELLQANWPQQFTCVYTQEHW